MGKKTAGRRLALRDTSRATERQFLSYADDTKDIYYEYDEPAPEAPAEAEKAAVPPAAVPAPKPEPAAAPAAPTPQPAPVIAAKATDVPLTATDVVLAIVAMKMKQPFDQVSVQKSIRDLSAGL